MKTAKHANGTRPLFPAFLLFALALTVALALLLAPLATVAGAEPKVVDDANLLTSSQRSSLASKCEDIESKWEVDIVVVTTNDTGNKSSMEYADDYYDYNGYGVGLSRDGALLLIDMQHRKIWLSTTGSMYMWMGDDDINLVLDAVANNMSNNNYYKGIDAGLDALNFYAKSIHDNVRSSYTPANSLTATELAVSLGAGAVVAAIFAVSVNLSYARAYKPYNYTANTTLELTDSADILTSSHTTRTALPRNTGGSSGSGGHSGGGGGHVSSSGTSHGGGGRSF